ncbi:MAG TPA: NADH-quinone oxidoreductase subunit C [Candidatus Aphodovivens avistercoris]|nr:NADH-quinone oxidoreductase subunit C [Candidatus Aphodovivens avistercoris]
MALQTEYLVTALENIEPMARERKADGWRFVQMMAVNTEDGIDLIYSFMKDGVLQNNKIEHVRKDDAVPSISGEFLEAFVFENEVHDLFGVDIRDIAIDFGGNFYALAQPEPMTVISPAQKAAREKARAAAIAKAERAQKAAAANAAYVADHPGAKAKRAGGVIVPSDDGVEEKLKGMDPEKVARVRAAMAAKAKRAAAEQEARKQAELEEKLAGMDPEKAAKVRAAMEAKKARAGADAKEGE